MNLLFINHYSGLPATTPATRTYDLAVELAHRGNHVTVFACSLNHYTLKEEHLRFWQLYSSERVDNVRFFWIRGLAYQSNDWRRLVNMIVFSIITLTIGLMMRSKPDVVIGTTVHPFAPLVAWCVAKLRRAIFWYDITDIWPQSLIDLGHISANGLAARLFSSLEKFSMRHADRVVSVLPNIAEYVRDCGLPEKPTAWIPNGISRHRLNDTSIGHTGMEHQHDCFVITYAGGFAPAHALDVVIDAAILLQKRHLTNIRIELIGDGPEMSRIRARIEDQRLQNISLIGFLPKQNLYKQLERADGFLVTGRNLSVYRYGISYNKIFDYLLIGRPIIFCVGSANNPIAEAGAGISAPPEDPAALCEAIITLSKMPHDEREMMGRRAREYVKREFDYSILSNKLIGLVLSDCGIRTRERM